MTKRKTVLFTILGLFAFNGFVMVSGVYPKVWSEEKRFIQHECPIRVPPGEELIDCFPHDLDGSLWEEIDLTNETAGSYVVRHCYYWAGLVLEIKVIPEDHACDYVISR